MPNTDRNLDNSSTAGAVPFDSEHTPGPWTISGTRDINGAYLHIGAPTSAVALASLNPSHIHVEANARLIAAAPDLLEALKTVMNDLMLLGKATTATSMRAFEAIGKALPQEASAERSVASKESTDAGL